MRSNLYVHCTIRSKTRLLYTVTRIHYLQKNVLAVKLKIAKKTLSVFHAQGIYQKTPTRFFFVVVSLGPPHPDNLCNHDYIICKLYTERRKTTTVVGEMRKKQGRGGGGADLMTRQQKNVHYYPLNGSTRPRIVK
jgi:hypothetical protein